jgi:hypothetical protein
MPANLPPDYHRAEERYRAAKTTEEKIACLEETDQHLDGQRRNRDHTSLREPVRDREGHDGGAHLRRPALPRLDEGRDQARSPGRALRAEHVLPPGRTVDNMERYGTIWNDRPDLSQSVAGASIHEEEAFDEPHSLQTCGAEDPLPAHDFFALPNTAFWPLPNTTVCEVEKSCDVTIRAIVAASLAPPCTDGSIGFA